MTYLEAKAKIYASVRQAGFDPDKVSPRDMEAGIQMLLDDDHSPVWSRIKWFPTVVLTSIRIWLMQGLTWLIKLATPRT